jgi:hypothetical protein
MSSPAKPQWSPPTLEEVQRYNRLGWVLYYRSKPMCPACVRLKCGLETKLWDAMVKVDITGMPDEALPDVIRNGTIPKWVNEDSPWDGCPVFRPAS